VNRVESIDELYDFIGYIVLCAPDQFPKEDFLAPEDQLSLEKAFVALQEAIGLIDPEVAPPKKRVLLSNILEESLAAYRRGDDVKGAHLLQDFRDLIFEPPDKKHN
jgi:hypothetical protein